MYVYVCMYVCIYMHVYIHIYSELDKAEQQPVRARSPVKHTTIAGVYTGMRARI